MTQEQIVRLEALRLATQEMSGAEDIVRTAKIFEDFLRDGTVPPEVKPED